MALDVGSRSMSQDFDESLLGKSWRLGESGPLDERS